MMFQRFAVAAVFAVGLAALPAPAVKAQPYGCYSPAFWPFCTAVGIATTIVTLPLWIFNPPAYNSYPPPAPYPPPPPDVYPQAQGGPYYYTPAAPPPR